MYNAIRPVIMTMPSAPIFENMNTSCNFVVMRTSYELRKVRKPNVFKRRNRYYIRFAYFYNTIDAVIIDLLTYGCGSQKTHGIIWDVTIGEKRFDNVISKC